MNSYIAIKEAGETSSAFYLSSAVQARQAVEAGYSIYEEIGDDQKLIATPDSPEAIPEFGPSAPVSSAGRLDPELLRALKIILEGGE